MARYSIFQGDKGLWLKHKLNHIYTIRNPDKLEFKEIELLEFAQEILIDNIEILFNYELQKSISGDIYEFR